MVATSACSTTVVVTRLAGSEPLLLAGTGSGVVDVLAAMSSSVPAAGAVTVTLYAWLAPLASEAIAGQVTTLPLTVPPPVALTKVTDAGSVSVSDYAGGRASGHCSPR